MAHHFLTLDITLTMIFTRAARSNGCSSCPQMLHIHDLHPFSWHSSTCIERSL